EEQRQEQGANPQNDGQIRRKEQSEGARQDESAGQGQIKSHAQAKSGAACEQEKGVVSLDQYAKKRDFKKSPEPAATRRRKKPGFSYLIQKHDASHLHYDFRLELEGMLKSWAIPKGPSLNPADKRLAVHVEDHPLAYGSFEGTI